MWWATGRHPEATLRLPRGYPEVTLSQPTASPKHLQSLRVAAQARLEPWHCIEKSGEPSDGADVRHFGVCGTELSHIWTRHWSLSCTSQTDPGCPGDSWETHRILAGYAPDTRRR